MKNPKRIIVLLGIATLALTGCNKDLIVSDKGNIVTVTKDDKELPLLIDSIFDEYLNEADGLSAYYNAVYEVVVRELFEKNQQTKRKEIYDRAELRVKDVKDQAKSNAEGGKSYKEELESLLKTHNVEDIDELKEKFAYELMETELKDQFYDGSEGTWIHSLSDQNWAELMSGDGDDYVGYLERRLPYHVRHLLVKVGAESSDYVTSKISRDDAIRLSSAVVALAERSGNATFGSLANAHSEDEGSRDDFGDLGIMSTNTGYVNEFKLGVYVYEKLYNLNPDRDADKIDMPNDAVDFFTNLGIGRIPYGAIEKLYEYRELEKSTLGKEVNDGDASYYPRNIIFNKYFNKHNVSVIVPNDVNEATKDGVGAVNAQYEQLVGFQNVPELGETVLTDENQKVILVVRAGSSGSYEGIHFIVVERSGIVDIVNDVSMAEYYTVEMPGSKAYPKTDDGKNKNTFVNFLRGDMSLYKGRADKIKSDVKTFDPNIRDRMFEKLVELLDVKFHDKALEAKLYEYLENQRGRDEEREERENVELWNDWVEQLELQEYIRDTRLIEEEYITAFKAGTDYDGDWR